MELFYTDPVVFIFACAMVVYFFYPLVTGLLSIIFAPWILGGVLNLFRDRTPPTPKVEAKEPPPTKPYDAKYKIRNPFDNDPK